MDIMSLGVTVVVAFVLTAVQGYWMIPFLKKLHYGQTILEDGPTWHKNKQGTPTMGGAMFILGSILAVAAGYFTYRLNVPESGMDKTNQVYLFAGIAMAMGFGFLGFLDDYIKVVKKRNLGLRARQKLLGQIIIGVAYLGMLHFWADHSTMLEIPFYGPIDIGWLYYPFMLFVIIATVNAVNLTDGIDGLCGSVTFVAAVGFMIISGILSMNEMNILAVALAGACLGFLCWNLHPAKVFMGDTGSLFLGGMVIALAMGINMPVLLIFIGFIYMSETLSVILQVISFKLTGKRIFKMSPIHHHFELCGWSEGKIVTVFSLVTLVGVIISIAAVMMR